MGGWVLVRVFALGYLWIRRRHKPIKFLIPEIFFRPGSPRPFISSELLAHLGDSGRLRSPIKSAKKSLCRDDLLHLSGSPHAGRLLTSTQTAGATPTHTDSEPPCCISPFHTCTMRTMEHQLGKQLRRMASSFVRHIGLLSTQAHFAV